MASTGNLIYDLSKNKLIKSMAKLGNKSKSRYKIKNCRKHLINSKKLNELINIENVIIEN